MLVYQNVTGTFNLDVQDSWKVLNLQEIRILCNTTYNPVIINLPDITSLQGFWNVKIYVLDEQGNASNNNITINAFLGQTIDFAGNTSLTIDEDGVCIVCSVASFGSWIGLESNASGSVIPSTISYGLFSQIKNSPILTNSNVETSILGTFVGTSSVPANTFKIGDSFDLKMGGKISTLNNHEITFNIYAKPPIGADILLATSGLLQLSPATSKDWSLDVLFVIRAIGAPLTAEIHSNGVFQMETNIAKHFDGYTFDLTNNTTFNTLVNLQLLVKAKWNQTSVSDSIQSDFAVLTKIY